MTLDLRFSTPEELFGNDAAEDEAQSVFDSYAVYRTEISNFMNGSRPLQVVRAYKGEGKSALLRLVETNLQSKQPRPIVVKTTGPALSPQVSGSSSDPWVRAWKAQILKLIASEVGARISIAFGDDGISLVEEAERNGFKERSFVSTIADRLTSTKVPVTRTRPEIPDAGLVLKRYLDNGTDVWLIVDDIDQNFSGDAADKVKVATFFIAARQIFTQIPEIRIRLAVRPNVWATIKPEFEALSHVEQYMLDLTWPSSMFLDMLGRRVEGFLERTSQLASAGALSPAYTTKYEQLVSLVFESPVQWSGGRRPISTVLYTLSRHRPRWLIELCKVSALEAHRKKASRIALEHVQSELEAFGARRIQDMIAEFRSTCPQIEAMLVAFSGQNERYATDQLVKSIRDRIVPGVRPQIGTGAATTSPVEIAQFLFQIGFLSARLDKPDGGYEHFAYAERPNLLRVSTNLDEGMSWEIHPVFRDTLRLKNVDSKSEIMRRNRRDNT